MKNDEKLSKLTKIHVNGSTAVARRFNFTKKSLEQLPRPTNGQRSYYYDKHLRGLAVAVSPAGRKGFILYRKVAGRPERISIGPFPDLSIEQARGKASELNAQIAKGENPAAEKREVRGEMTLQGLFTQWAEHHGKQKRSWLLMQREFNVYLKPWHTRKLSSISKLNVIALQNSLKQKHGLYVSNHILRLLSSLYNRAIEWGWKGVNPVAHVSLFKEVKRDRFLRPAELPAFFKALATEPEIIRDFIMLALLTGARRANVQAMSWPQLDFVQRTWIIPAANAKGDEILTIPLLPQALAILTRRQKTATSEWVFPSSGKTGHLVEPKSAWKRIVKAAGLSDLRLHDLRRTLGSWQALTGASLLTIGKSLGHKSLAATTIYARLTDDSVRQSMGKAATSLLLAGKVQEDKT
jgi:integrase